MLLQHEGVLSVEPILTSVVGDVLRLVGDSLLSFDDEELEKARQRYREPSAYLGQVDIREDCVHVIACRVFALQLGDAA